MDDGGEGIPETNPNSFGTGLCFILHPRLGLRQGTEIVWEFEFGFEGGKNRPRPASLSCLVKSLRGKKIALVKVVWESPVDGSVTWELKSRIRKSHPKLFSSSNFRGGDFF